MRLKQLIAMMLSLSIINVNSQAACPNAVSLHVGDRVTDCDRIGLSLDYDKDVRKDLVEADYNKKIIEEQKKVIDLKDIQIGLTSKQSDLWKTEADRSRSELDKEKSRSDFKLYGGVIGGIVLTVLAGWAVGQVAK